MGHCPQEMALFALSLTWLKAVLVALRQFVLIKWQEMCGRNLPPP
jgi:hypothetical protein